MESLKKAETLNLLQEQMVIAIKKIDSAIASGCIGDDTTADDIIRAVFISCAGDMKKNSISHSKNVMNIIKFI